MLGKDNDTTYYGRWTSRKMNEWMELKKKKQYNYINYCYNTFTILITLLIITIIIYLLLLYLLLIISSLLLSSLLLDG